MQLTSQTERLPILLTTDSIEATGEDGDGE